MLNIKEKLLDLLTKKSAGFLGVDLGSYSIKIAEVGERRGKVELKSFGQTRTFENTLIKHEIVNKNLLATNIRNLVDNLKPTTINAIYSLPSLLTFYDNFTLTEIPDHETLIKKIADECPYHFDEISYSYYILPVESKFVVFYLYVKKEILNKFVELFSFLNLNLINVGSDFVVIHNFLEHLYGEHAKLVADLGYYDVRLIITNKEVPIATYHLSNLGIRRLEQEISKVFKVDKYQALKIIHNPKLSEIQIAKPLFVKYLEKLSEEILIKLDAVKNKYGIIPEVLYLIGGGARIPNISQILSQALEIPYQKIEIQQKIKINDNIHPDYLEIINTQGVLALATAVEEFL